MNPVRSKTMSDHTSLQRGPGTGWRLPVRANGARLFLNLHSVASHCWIQIRPVGYFHHRNWQVLLVLYQHSAAYSVSWWQTTSFYDFLLFNAERVTLFWISCFLLTLFLSICITTLYLWAWEHFFKSWTVFCRKQCCYFSIMKQMTWQINTYTKVIIHMYSSDFLLFGHNMCGCVYM